MLISEKKSGFAFQSTLGSVFILMRDSFTLGTLCCHNQIEKINSSTRVTFKIVFVISKKSGSSLPSKIGNTANIVIVEDSSDSNTCTVTLSSIYDLDAIVNDLVSYVLV